MCDDCGWQECLEDIGDALAAVSDIPSEGEDFASSVAEKLASIHEWVESHEHVTESQQQAVKNMSDGIQRWIR